VVEIRFIDAALDDLRRIGPDAVPRILKKVLLLVDDAEAGYPLGGALTGYRKLVVGRNTWRVVYRIADDKSVEICEVWAVGARADEEIYAEAEGRIRRAATDEPQLVQLAEVIRRLGNLARGLSVVQEIEREPVPDWLAQRLIHAVGIAREEVAALDLEEAVDLWTEYVSKPK
jgi:mRNA interferase RelE/StbE